MFDLPLDELKSINRRKQHVLISQTFWKASIEELNQVEAEPALEPYDYPVKGAGVPPDVSKLWTFSN
ncbi:acetylxylan esterase [Bacillus sp. SL00103]